MLGCWKEERLGVAGAIFYRPSALLVTKPTRICAADMAVRYAALAEKYMCVIVIR